MKQLVALYERHFNTSPAHVEEMPKAGSNRQYYRLTHADGSSVVGVVGTSRDENHAFIYLARHFQHRRLPVPEVIAVSDDELRYLQQDLGKRSLFDALKGGREAGGRYTLNERDLLVNTIRLLPELQIRGARGLDFSQCYPQPDFDEDSVLFDLNYFKYCFLKPTDLDFHELKLEANFRLMAKDLTAEKTDSFLYRDFQARNVMLLDDNRPYFIDFQGGRRGPYYYDLVRRAHQCHRGANKAPFRRQTQPIRTLPHFAGVGGVWVQGIFRTQTPFPGIDTPGNGQPARDAAHAALPLHIPYRGAAATYRIAAVRIGCS